MRLVAKGMAEMQWGGRFWLFATRYYMMPWYGWRASLAMKWNAAKQTPMWYRVSHPVVNYALLTFQVIFAVLWIRSVTQGEWWLIIVLLFPALTNLMAMLFRLQTVFKFSGERDKPGG